MASVYFKVASHFSGGQPKLVPRMVERVPGTREGKPQSVGTVQASACFMFAGVSLAKVSHMSKPSVNTGRDQRRTLQFSNCTTLPQWLILEPQHRALHIKYPVIVRSFLYLSETGEESSSCDDSSFSS